MFVICNQELLLIYETEFLSDLLLPIISVLMLFVILVANYKFH